MRRPLFFLAALPLLLLLGSCSRPLRAPRAAAPPSLRVMTYNVNFGLAGDPAGIAAIEAGQAQIVFLQEITLDWEEAIRTRLTARFPHMSFRHSGGAGGLAVLSRYPFSEGELLPSEGGWFPAWRVVVRSPLGLLQVLQLHLRPPVSDGGSWVSGYFTTRDFRRREAAHFASRLDPSLPTLVLGDFNEDAGGRAVRYFAARGLRSVLPEYHPRARTWRWQTSLGRISHTLDHVLYDGRLSPCDARVIDAGRSDHLPVVADFELARRPAAP